jgi:hypothetical protein
MSNEEKNVALYIAFEDIVPYDPALPERNLLRAIVLNALSDLKKAGEPQREATKFFLSDEEEYIFSFQSICNHLDIDPCRILTVAGLKKAPRQP